ncbi:MAG: sulfatase-like hydrolase/transferase [Pirellulales bacterium]|nr:sulfatase-like hydrolase/transferase [Pirellulales bacterium]
MNQPFAAILLGLLLPTVVSAARAAEVDRRPNVIFLLTDDQGWGDAAAWGHPYCKTPHLDRLTAEGRRFGQFYVANPVCSPSRTAFMTGRYPARFRIHGHFATHELNQARAMPDWLDPQVLTVTRQLQAAGYVTGHFGKWHLGGGEGAPEPGSYGIDSHVTIVSNGPQLREKDAPPEPHWWGKSTGIIMDHAIAFLRRNKDKPFYLNIWTLVPHAKLDPTPEQLAVYQDLDPRADHPAFGQWTRDYYTAAKDFRSQMQVYAASITDLDTQVGRLLDTLKELGLEEHTVLILSSDNGPEDYHIGNATNAGVGSPGPHRGRKRSIYEGGVRQPFVVRWPRKIRGGVFDETSVVGAVDFLPTLCALTGVKLPPDAELDGEDVSDILLGGQTRPRKKPLFWEWRSTIAGNPEFTPPPIAVRDGPWKLLTNRDRSRVELYNVPDDPAETNSLAAANPEVVERLARLALQWKATLPPGEEQPLPRAKAKAQGKPAPDRAAMFETKDGDRNGKLTLEEYLRNFPDQAEGRRRFPTFDANGDGVLSREEFITMGGKLKP